MVTWWLPWCLAVHNIYIYWKGIKESLNWVTAHSVASGKWFKSMLRKFFSELWGLKHFKTIFYLTGHYWIEQGSVWTDVMVVYSRSRFFVFTWVQDEAPLFLHVQWKQIKEFRFFAFCIRGLIQGQLSGNAPIDFSGFGSDFNSVVTGLKTNIFISLEFYWRSFF